MRLQRVRRDTRSLIGSMLRLDQLARWRRLDRRLAAGGLRSSRSAGARSRDTEHRIVRLDRRLDRRRCHSLKASISPPGRSTSRYGDQPPVLASPTRSDARGEVDITPVEGDGLPHPEPGSCESCEDRLVALRRAL